MPRSIGGRLPADAGVNFSDASHILTMDEPRRVARVNRG